MSPSAQLGLSLAPDPIPAPAPVPAPPISAPRRAWPRSSLASQACALSLPFELSIVRCVLRPPRLHPCSLSPRSPPGGPLFCRRCSGSAHLSTPLHCRGALSLWGAQLRGARGRLRLLQASSATLGTPTLGPCWRASPGGSPEARAGTNRGSEGIWAKAAVWWVQGSGGRAGEMGDRPGGWWHSPGFG